MSVTSAEFWNLLLDSRLLPADQLRQWQAAARPIERTAGPASATAVARWLVRQQVLTAYQAEQLLNGRAGPFRYGDYAVQERIRCGRLRGMFRARHDPTRFPVLLRFAAARVAQDPRQWSLARQYHRHTVVPVHPCLQRVYALEESAGYRFLVCESLEGESLAARLPAGVGWPMGEACWIVQRVALGLAALHETRQTHGDVQPANVWQDVDGQVKLLRDWVLPPVVPDFASAVGSAAASVQARYAAPELAHPGTPLSVLTDMYALGCTLYEMVVGETPLAGGAPADVLARRATAALPSLEPRGVPAPLSRLLEALLAADPRQRIDSASEVAQRLSPLADCPSAAAPPLPPVALAAYESALAGPRTACPAPPPILSNLPERAGAATVFRPPEPAPVPPPLPDVREEVGVGTEGQVIAPAVAIPDVAGTDRTPTARRRRQQRVKRRRALSLMAWATVLLVLAIAVGTWQSGWQALFGPNVATVPGTVSPDTSPPRDTSAPPGQAARPSEDTDNRYQIVADDGASLWMPPTQAGPLVLSYVPPGTQILLMLRVADLLATDAHRQLVDVLGPGVANLRDRWESDAGHRWNDVEQLVIGWREGGAGLRRPTCVVWLREPRSLEQLVAAWGNPSPVQHEGNAYFPSRGWSFFVPPDAPRGVFVMGDETDIREVIEQGDSRPLLRRDLAQLWQASDQLHHVTLLVATDCLFAQVLADGRPLALGDIARARRSLEWFLGSEIRACLASLHVGDHTYFELRGMGQTHSDSPRIADAWRTRLRELPDRVEAHFVDAYPSAYWRRVALRVPEMMRVTAQYARVGIEQDQAVLNVVLPATAAHNLLFVASMAWDETRDAMEMAGPAPAAERVPQSLDELLATPFTVSFSLQSLEAALQNLVNDVQAKHPALPFPFAIKMAGQDLQLEGITRNQQIANFEATNQPLADILTALVMRANPVATLTVPADPAQKLIWTPAPDPQDPTRQILLITTRVAAARNSYNLPAVFRQP